MTTPEDPLDARILSVCTQVRDATARRRSALELRAELFREVKRAGVPVRRVSDRILSTLRAAGWPEQLVTSPDLGLSTGSVRAVLDSESAST